MKAIIAKKESQVKTVSEHFNSAKSFIIFEYQGLDAATITSLRKSLRASGSQLCVLKNNILDRSLKAANITGFESLMQGPNAVAIAYEDEISIFKMIADVEKEHKFIKIKGGYINGGFIDAAQVKQLSAIPGREGLYGMLLSCLTSPIRSFLYGIKAVADTKQQ